MIVSPHHGNVDSDGFVRVTYLDTWRNTSTLTDLVKNLQTLFGEKPPLYSKPQSTKLSTNQTVAYPSATTVLTDGAKPALGVGKYSCLHQFSYQNS
jgi:hypothetical protein